MSNKHYIEYLRVYLNEPAMNNINIIIVYIITTINIL